MSLIKSKQRVADHGEVFTPPWMVEAMLDLVKDESDRIDARFLEPACGSGNFLVRVLQRKLAAVELKYSSSDFERRHYALLALMCIYGIELLADNIAECGENLLAIFAEYLRLEKSDHLWRGAVYVLSQNLVHGDALTMRASSGAPITFAEWGYLGKGKYQRRDFRLDILTQSSAFSAEDSLFAHLGKHEIFTPVKTYTPVTVEIGGPMSAKASFALRGRNPDILTCIANLSNDEVFTPPEFANRMLDTLAAAWAADHAGGDIWAEKSLRFLDPCTKSGVFLREITSRLVNGLAKEIPNLQDRVTHILTEQVFGIGITQLTGLLARRSVYCSKHATGVHSIAKEFSSDEGNIWFKRVEHSWKDDRCEYCGASRAALDRGEGLETHAYAFIHTDNIKTRVAELFGGDMQFDVIIGNPPYQLEDGGFGTSAAPIYQLFVEQALALDPRYAVFVTPSRWMTGGKGLDKYRERMLADKHMRAIVDFPKLYEAFPGVKIRGGISYFLWDRGREGPCDVQTIWDGQPTGPAVARYLNAYDILVRRNEAVSILEKVRAKNEPTLDARVSTGKPFGFRTFFHGKPDAKNVKRAVKLFGSQKVSWISRTEITVNPEWVGDWKVLMTAVQGTSAAIETKFLSRPIIAEPGTACTETYLVAGRFDNERHAVNYAQYLRTRFVRFLVSLRKATQHATRDVYAFVPDLSVEEPWTDAKLYKRYKLSGDEVVFIESQVAEHDGDLFDEDASDQDADE